MAFPTSSLTNNQVHKEGNRAFVYDSALGVWDQVRETDRTENKILSGEIGAGATFPAGHIIQTTNTTYNSDNSDATTSATMARVVKSGSYHWTGQITGVLASSWVSITMSFNGESFKAGVSNTGSGFGIFRETTLIMDAQKHALYVYVGTTTYADIYSPITLTFVDKTPATGTNNYYLGYNAHSSASTTVMSTTAGSATYQPFVCTLQEIAQ